MARPRFYKLAKKRQTAILEATAKELASHGYEKASLNRILEHANMSKGAAYYYFEDKADLVATVFTSLWKQVLSEMKLDIDTLTADSFWPSIEGIAKHFTMLTEKEPWLVSAAKALWSLPPGARSEGPLGEAFQTMIGWLATLLKKGRQVSQVRSDLPEDLLLSMVLALDDAADRWMAAHWDNLSPKERKRLSALIFDIWRRLMMPVNGETP